MDLISVVIAVYNAENTIKKCIDSILQQTYKEFEIILVNDASIDSSLSMCDYYSANYDNIIAISNERNLGVSATRNKGIDHSSGKYICFIDSDDYLEPEYLEKLYTYFKLYNTVPICGFVCHDYLSKRSLIRYSWSGGNELVSLGKAFQLSEELYLAALWNKLFDNEIIKQMNIRFDESISMGEDLQFTLDYFDKSGTEKVFVTSDTLYHYNKLNDNSLLSNIARNGIEKALKRLRSIESLAKKFNSKASEEYNRKKTDLIKTYVYFIIRDKKYTDKEKLYKIREFQQQFTTVDYIKEKLKYALEKVKEKY